MMLKLEEVQLPKVTSSVEDEIHFQKEATLHDVALCMEVWFANWSGLENGEYQVGHRFFFHRLPSGETLCGRVDTFEGVFFYIDAILLADQKTLVKNFIGYKKNSKFVSLLESFGLQDKIELGASEN